MKDRWRLLMLVLIGVCLIVSSSKADSSFNTGGIYYVSGVPTYSFPDRWQSMSFGWISDCFSFHKKAYVTGFIFTDYALGKQRIDEVWNMSSIAGTGLSEWGIVADTHIFGAKGKAWYYFLNTSGPQCSISPSGFLAQNTFSDPSTYVGNVSMDGRLVYHFTSFFPFPLNKLAIDFYVDPEAQIPLLMVIPKVGTVLDGSVVYYADFQAVIQAWPNPSMFSPPDYCVGAGLDAAPGCTKSSLRS